ncbi:squalene synthase-like isoform X1 [Eleutherodactylus coqui]|uniref:squalene synthase-like isoform X1 n=2 Tax=Eleutherodactylus coqui TaxID=57060 RepID=UPI003462F94D
MDFLRSLGHPEEIYNLLRFKMGCRTALSQQERDSMSDSLQTCYKYMNKATKNITAIVLTLDGKLRDAACIFYLVLRALDTVEDDMTISLETKIPMLNNFHTYLYQPDWRFTESKDEHRQVLAEFPTISQEFRKLPAMYQKVIADTCHKVGVGMAEFSQKQIESLLDWDQYGHYASELVVIGVFRLLSASELEDTPVVEDPRLLNSMGLMFQKANIIRDYLEDELEGRAFWPGEVWRKYSKNLSDLAKPENIVPAVQCLNELVTNALQHIPDILLYLSQARDHNIFRWVAILEIISVARLAACYNNPQVFKGEVRLRKGQLVTIFMDATNIQAVRAIVYQCMNEINQKIPLTDPSAEHTQNIVSTIQKLCLSDGPLVSRHGFSLIYLPCAVLLAVLSWQYLSSL